MGDICTKPTFALGSIAVTCNKAYGKPELTDNVPWAKGGKHGKTVKELKKGMKDGNRKGKEDGRKEDGKKDDYEVVTEVVEE